MRITGVESTDLFTGSAGRPLQIIRVTVTGEPGDLALAGTLRVEGAGISQPEPFRVEKAEKAEPAQARTVEVGIRVADHHRPGTQVPVTVIAQAGDARAEGQRAGEYRAEHAAMITVAEPGWTMWMVSHFHYDPVWWSTQGQFTEARLVLPDEDGEMPDTRTAFDLVHLHLEKARRDPDYKFVLAEIDYLKPHFDVFPQDRAFVRELLATGRLELVGGTYNEPNTNLTGAEVTIRNAVYGMGFQRDVLGGDPRSAWMLDGFGHDPGFPGLMAQAGLTSSSWARGPFHQWGPEDNARMQYPAEFEWLSPDGNGILTAYMADHYGAGWSLHQAADLGAAQVAALGQFRSLAAVAATRNVMLPVGADHVIPARWVTDVHRSWNDTYVWPRFVTAIPREFFDAVRAEAGSTTRSTFGASPGARKITPQTRDMNPVYTGKDVSYIDTKQAHRAGETAVLEAERLATLAWLSGAPYPAESLDKAWRLLAYGAHHDAITGTESDQVYLDLLAGWREAWDRGAAARRDAIAALAGPTEYPPEHPQSPGAMTVTVVNGLARERDGMATVTVRVDEPGTPWLAVIDEPATGGAGSLEVPALAEGITRHPDGSLAEVTLTFRASRVPALGLRAYALRPVPGHPRPGWTDIPASAAHGSAAENTANEHIAIENDAYAITADPSRGGTLSIIDKRSGQPVLRGPGNEMVLQEEHDKHPRWGEGAWHLSPKGPGTGSSSLPAGVRAQRCPAGSRLLATFTLGELRITQETLLWDGADRVEFRTHVDGSIGKDNLLRARFPALVPGGLPVYQTATAVIGRPFGFPEADTAAHWWTLDNPAHHWFGLGSVARVALASPGGLATLQAIGVAEVITPDALMPNESPDPARALLISLAGAGVTATCSRAAGPRYGAVDVDSNVPDFRIALGGPQDNAFTAEVLAACEPPVAKRLSALVAEHGSARLWVPAGRPRSATVVPDADLRAVRDLPVLIVAGPAGSAEGLASAVAGLRADLTAGGLTAVVEGELASEEALADGTVALFNRGTPSGVVAPDGALWMSLMRACSSWPAGVWIDGDRRTVPDGSSFGWQHWSHTFCYALASASSGGWRSGGFNAAAEDYNHDLATAVYPRGPSPLSTSGEGGETPLSPPSRGKPAESAGRSIPWASVPGMALLTVGPPNVTLSALKPRGNPLASGHPGTPPASGEITVRLRETDGRRTVARVELAGGIASAAGVDLLEEATGAAMRVSRGAAHVELPPFGTATIAIRPAAVPAVAADGPRTPPEKALPVHTRYWLHGKGPAPAGNLPVAVHLAPSRVTLRPSALEGFDAPAGPAPGDDAGRLRLSVACGPEPASGAVELLVPDGLVAEVGDAPAASGTMLAYSLDGGEHATWDVTVRALPGTADGRYFAGARIADTAGLTIEDTALVTVGEPGGVEPDLPPEELFFRMQADVEALAGEADLEVLTPALSLAPGAQGQVKVAVTSRLASELRGEAQLLSPFGSWEAVAPWDSVAPWIQSVRPGPGQTAQLEFPVRIPATAAPGWETWLLVKLMYFGRVRYSEAIRLTVAEATA
jgi:alpha-mannosidase